MPEQWRCSRGHEWEGEEDVLVLTIWEEKTNGCARCVRDWMREYVGRVKAVK